MPNSWGGPLWQVRPAGCSRSGRLTGQAWGQAVTGCWKPGGTSLWRLLAAVHRCQQDADAACWDYSPHTTQRCHDSLGRFGIWNSEVCALASTHNARGHPWGHLLTRIGSADFRLYWKIGTMLASTNLERAVQIISIRHRGCLGESGGARVGRSPRADWSWRRRDRTAGVQLAVRRPLRSILPVLQPLCTPCRAHRAGSGNYYHGGYSPTRQGCGPPAGNHRKPFWGGSGADLHAGCALMLRKGRCACMHAIAQRAPLRKLVVVLGFECVAGFKRGQGP